ncbi:hypothetical protein DFJ73DRAFT_756492 [Zopfochytrium polystomum]|nr:hypothetical protein DFJ73DRAFT_756492 [Zopfochytrium polystomum]
MEDVQISGELTYRRPRYVTFEEFARARPFMSSFQHWVHALEKLQEIPDPVLPEEPEFEWDEKAPLVEWSSMSTYWKGVLAFTGDQLVEVFGKVSFLEKELIPLSMVESFMNKKVEWDQ